MDDPQIAQPDLDVVWDYMTDHYDDDDSLKTRVMDIRRKFYTCTSTGGNEFDKLTSSDVEDWDLSIAEGGFYTHEENLIRIPDESPLWKKFYDLIQEKLQDELYAVYFAKMG